MRLCNDVQTLCLGFLTKSERLYVSNDWMSIENSWAFATRNEFTDLMRTLTARDWTTCGMRMVRFLRNEFKIPMLKFKPQNLEILKYTVAKGVKWEAEDSEKLALHGDAEMLSYAMLHFGVKDSIELCTAAVRSQNVDCLRVALELGCPPTKESLACAAERGLVDMLSLLLSKGGSWVPEITWHAADAGQVSVFMFARINDLEICDSCVRRAVKHLDCMQYLHEIMGFPLDYRVVEWAQELGSLDVIKYLIDKGYHIDLDVLVYRGNIEALRYLQAKTGIGLTSDNARVAARRAHIEVLQLAIESGVSLDGDILVEAAKSRDTDVVEFLIANGCEWDASACTAAVHDLNMLKYLHNKGCPWDVYTCTAAAANFRSSSLMYAIENGCPVDHSVVVAAAERGSLQCLGLLHDKGLRLSMDDLHVHQFGGDVIRFISFMDDFKFDFRMWDEIGRVASMDAMINVRAKGLEWSADTCAIFALNNALQCLQYAHGHGCPWDENTCLEAAAVNAIACLEFAHENGCPWTVDVLREAAKHDSKECFIYALQNGCPRDATVCYWAASCDLPLLRTARHFDCPWDASTCTAAAQRKCMTTLMFAREGGCPWDVEEIIRIAKQNNDGTMLRYALANR